MTGDGDGDGDDVEKGQTRTFGGSDPGDARDAWAKLRDDDLTDRDEKAVETQQGDTTDSDLNHVKWYEPPYPPTNLAFLKERSETHAACVHAKAQGVAGYGFDLVPHDEIDEDDASDDERETVRDFWFGPDSTWQLGPDRAPATATEVWEQAWDDYEAIGWLSVEMLRSVPSMEPTGAAHVPAHTIRVRKDAPGFVQINPSTTEVEGYFAPAGFGYGDDPQFIDAETGDVLDNALNAEGDVANELFVMRNYSALAPHYGIPDVIPAMQTLMGDLAARDYNINFFQNDGVPRMAVIVEGGELSERAWNNLEEKFANLRKDENDHRGILLEASNLAKAHGEKHNVEIRIEPLTVGVEEDASFIDYRKENEHDLLKAHSVQPVIANRTEDANYANAESQRREFANTTISPRQERLAARIHSVIHQTMLDVDDWTVGFELHGGENAERQAGIAKTRIEGSAGVMTVDEARAELGKDPLGGPEGEMLVAELGGDTSGTGQPVVDEDDVEQARQVARQRQRAADHGYSIVERADGTGDD